MATTDNQIDGLTDEERAALELDEDNSSFGGVTVDQAEKTTQAADNSDEPDGKGDNGDGGGNAGADTAAKPDNASDTAAAGKDGEQASATPEPEAKENVAKAEKPIFVAQAPEDAAAQLQAIAEKKESLFNQFDDGDITAAEYQKGLDEVNKEERKIERAIDRAELAKEIDEQKQKNSWTEACDAFLADNPRYNPEANHANYVALDAEVRRVAASPEFKDRKDSLAGHDILKKAHENIMEGLNKEFGVKPQGKAAETQNPAATKKPGNPPSLHSLPAAQVEDVTDGKFGYLDRLSGVELEKALSKMSPDEMSAYMKQAG